MNFKQLILVTFIPTFVCSGNAISGQEQKISSENKNTKESGQPYDIAVVNIDKLLHECKAAKQVQIELETQRFKFQEEMKKQEEFFLAWDKKLVEQQKDMKSEEFAEKRKEFDAKLAKVHQKATQHREQLEAAFNEAMTTVQETILLLIRDAAVENKYKLVIPRSFVIFREDALEITDELLKKLDEKLPSLTLKWS
ncbi:outer membrane protein [Caedimonas varicaedens]|uniref:Outer membrane protein n=1 Tax=Caedimonas varicaedens TaxID=1629334 RepID=A0A0K8MC10_9PROT|nr:outer membrane protein [Caedimonas varicaedens]GAO98002.1 outer membrane protein [Caedimonas varicaedens]